jgi:5-methylcytosine-specific restriction endonuclease McrA
MSQTLLLNSDFNPISILPLSVVSWQHAVKLMFLDRVTVIETYPDQQIRSEHLTIEMPSVCVTKEYFNYKKAVKFSRQNLFLRDLYQCQYCADTFNTNDLTLDHVIPRSSGGKTVWENSVTACKPCNHRKGSKLLKPLRAPFKPDYYNLIGQWRNCTFHIGHPTWNKYLGIGDAAVNGWG